MALDRNSLDRLKDLVGGDQSDLADLISAFLEEAPELMQTMQIGLRSADIISIRRAAHSLKSNALDMGAVELADTCARIELVSAQGGMAQSVDVAFAQALLNEAIEELQRLMTNGL